MISRSRSSFCVIRRKRLPLSGWKLRNSTEVRQAARAKKESAASSNEASVLSCPEDQDRLSQKDATGQPCLYHQGTPRYSQIIWRQTALDIKTLKNIGITHVLNASEGSETYKGFVNTGASYYSSAGIKYKGFPAYDNLSYDLSQHFSDAAEFIDDALKSHGKVLVHCYMGVSRSATLVLAFLMIKRAMTAQDAIKIVRSKREINPNSNFLQQLCNLNGLLMSRCY
ncbi:hypothetical protein J437_LFUL018679 [Ladona fulva]|uniref:Dual specificity protein phosphatase n=1 Tax=Ladona fulva TaxID=123851 RepID=A0A8K0KP31_LADFU|nr:hypothetical protein J437_LFUL018679 [Ladona fulva]